MPYAKSFVLPIGVPVPCDVESQLSYFRRVQVVLRELIQLPRAQGVLTVGICQRHPA